MSSVAVKVERCLQVILCWRNSLCGRKFHLMSTAWCHSDENSGERTISKLQNEVSVKNGADSPRMGLGLEEVGQQPSVLANVDRTQLERLIEEFKLDKAVRKLSREHLITGTE